MGLLEQASLVITPNAVKAGKLYSVIPNDGTGDLDVVRATSATRVNSAGLIETVGNNIARLDYTNGSCPSILVEPQRTNLALWSEEFDNSYWRKVSCSIVPNQEIAPNGTLTADYVVEDNTTGLRYVGVVGVPTSIGQTYTFSVFVKKKDRSQISIHMNEGDTIFPLVKFNFDTETFTQTSPLMTSSFQSVGNGWFRLIFTRTPTTGTSTVFSILPLDASGNFNQTGDGVSRTIIWGAQLELGSNATSYIPTTSSAVTRNADIISKSGISNLIGQTEGTIFVEFNLSTEGTSIGSGIIELTPAGGEEGEINRILIYKNLSNKQIGFQIRAGGATNILNRVFSAPANGLVKVAIGYKSGNSFVCINGSGFSHSETFAFTQTLNFIKLGASLSQNVVINDCINSLSIFKTRLDNATLQTLTTL
jgi:hypothetical protein